MALAQLDRLRPLKGTGYSFVKLAQALNLAEPTTSFHLSEGDLRKTLSRLTDRLIGPGEKGVERVRLPEYARKHEFPLNPPIIAGISEKEVPKRLYTACSSLQLERRASINGVNLWAARLLETNFRHLPLRKLNTKGE